MNRQGQIPEHGTLSRYRGSNGVPACRCPKCSAKAVREDSLRLLDRLAGRPRLVPAAPVQEHLQKLRSLGLSYAAIARAAGADPTNVSEICRGQRQDVLRRVSEALLAVPADLRPDQDPIERVSSIGSVRRVRALYAIAVTRDLIASQIGCSKAFVNILAAGRIQTVRPATAQAVSAAYDRLWLMPGTSVKNRLRAQREGWLGPLHWADDALDDPNAEPLTDQDTQAMSSKDRHTEVLHLADGGVVPSLIAERVGLSESRVRQILYAERPVLCRHLAATSLKAPGMRDAA